MGNHFETFFWLRNFMIFKIIKNELGLTKKSGAFWGNNCAFSNNDTYIKYGMLREGKNEQKKCQSSHFSLHWCLFSTRHFSNPNFASMKDRRLPKVSFLSCTKPRKLIDFPPFFIWQEKMLIVNAMICRFSTSLDGHQTSNLSFSPKTRRNFDQT